MTPEEAANLQVANVIDARGTACPGPLLEAKKGIGSIKVGEILEVKSSDQGSRNDLAAWAKKVGHEFLGYVEADGHDRLFIKRTK